MSATSVSNDARAQTSASWIGGLGLFTGITTWGTMTFLASEIGWHGPVANAAGMSISLLTAAVAGYPWVHDVRRRHGMSPVPFRTCIFRMIALALALLALMSVMGPWSR